MAVLNTLLSPISISFIVIIIGYYIGRIKIFEVSLDLSGVLIVAVFTGYVLSIITSFETVTDISEYESHMKFFSAFGTALFVSSIGLSNGSIFSCRRWNDCKSALIGSLMIFSAFATMRIISVVDNGISVSKLVGSLCGALSTTPGMSAACESENLVSEEITLGYGCTYLFGVLATVLFTQITTRKTKMDIESSCVKAECYDNNSALSGLIQISSTIILGRLIGAIEIFDFSLGNSGGMLCSGITIGLFVKQVLPQKSLSTEKSKPFRDMGLALFFVGNGISSGMQVYSQFDVKMVLYGGLMTIIPITVGLLLYKIFFKNGNPAVVIAGGMTSTPAISVIIQKIPSMQLNNYSLSYISALMTTIFLIRSTFV